MYTCTHGFLKQSADVNYFYLTARSQDEKIRAKLKTGEDFFVKSHFPYHDNLPFKENIKVCIYIVRNPIHTLLSRIDHYILEGLEQVDSEQGRSQVIHNFIQYADAGINEHTPANFSGGWNHNVVSWLETNKEIPVYLVRYEDLLDDTEGVISKLNEDLSLGFSKENIKTGCALSSFQNMRQLEAYELEHEIIGAFYSPTRKRMFLDKKIQFVHKGRSRSHDQYLSTEITEKITTALSQGMKLAGYS